MTRAKTFLKKFLSITPLKVSLVIVLVFGVLSFIQDISTTGLPILSTLENKSLDIKFLLRGPQKPKANIVILAIDEKALQTFGQWPFDRGSILAKSFEKICSYNIKSLGLDAMWPEMERALNPALKTAVNDLARRAGTSGEALLQEYSGDVTLSRALQKCGHKIVLGYSMEGGLPEFANETQAKDYLKRKETLITSNKITNLVKTKEAFVPNNIEEAQNPSFPNTDFKYFRFSAILNNNTITYPGVAQGFMDNESESDDGNYRQYIPIMALDGNFLPSISLRMAMKYFATSSNNGLEEAKPYVFLPDMNANRTFSLRLKTAQDMITFPTDKVGRMVVNYRGPNYMYPHVSLADVLSNEDTISYTPAFELYVMNSGNPKEEPKPITFLKKEFFNNALVLFGATARGVFDLRPRPFAQDAFGVENHASILDNLINNDFLEKPNAESLMMMLTALVILGLIFGAVITRLGAKTGFVFAITTMGGLLYFDQVYLFNKKNIIFPGHLQALQFLFQYLAITVMKYMHEEADKKFIRSAFDKFVSPAVIESMLSDPSKLKIGGEKKALSILFSDVAGFTELSEKIDVHVLTQFLNEYLGSMTDIVQANQGTLDKYIGDAVMAFWGAPIDNSQHALMAVKTAVEMQQKLVLINKTFKEKYGFEIEVRIGINSGEVSVGNFGSSRVFEYTVIGDNVNLASRLEGVNKYYGTSIIISENTYGFLPSNHGFVTREIDLIKVKGKHKPVKIYQVVPDATVLAPVKDIIPQFQQGLANYYSRKWDKAIISFNEVLQRVKNDKAAQEFIERCNYYKDKPPQSDWDGSWEMHSK